MVEYLKVFVVRIGKDHVVSVYCSAAVYLLISNLNPVLYSVRLTRSTSCTTVERPHNLAAVVKW